MITKKAELDEDLETRITKLEVDEKTSKSRIESLESWIQKHDEKLKEIGERGEKDHENIEMLKKKLVSLEGVPKHTKDKTRIEKKCKHCEQTFSRNCDLEKHMDEHEETGKGFKCNTCEKTFYLKWRQNKHEKNHHTIGVNHCRYFSHQEPCPYEAIGCKFLHVQSEVCSLDECHDLLCPLTHQNVRNDEEVANDMEDEDQEPVGGQDGDAEAAYIDGKDGDADDDFPINENQCHLCKKQLLNRDELWDHVEKVHEDYFQGMLEYAAENRL